MRRTALYCAVVLTLASAPVFSAPIDLTDPADSASLETVLAEGAIVGDKLFTEFDYVGPVDPASIMVRGGSFGGEWGLTFASSGFSVAGVGATDVNIAFRVTAGEGFLIVDNTLWIEGTDIGDGYVYVTENVYSKDPFTGIENEDELAAKSVYDFGPNASVPPKLTDHQEFPGDGYKDIWVVKDIHIIGTSSTSFTSFYLVGQSFSQIPEPATMVLLAVSGLGLILRKRRALAVLLVLLTASVVLPVSTASAAPVGLDAAIVAEPGETFTLEEVYDLNNGIVVGDKWFRFMGWGWQEQPITDQQVTVKGYWDEANNGYGLIFNGPWSAALGGSSEFTMQYDVFVLDPDQVIDRAEMWMTASGAETGADSVVVTKTIDVYEGATIGTLQTSRDGNGAKVLTDGLDLDNLQQLSVSDRITITSELVAGVSEFYQVFYQVPEPASFAVLALGSMALLRRRRRS